MSRAGVYTSSASPMFSIQLANPAASVSRNGLMRTPLRYNPGTVLVQFATAPRLSNRTNWRTAGILAVCSMAALAGGEAQRDGPCSPSHERHGLMLRFGHHG